MHAIQKGHSPSRQGRRSFVTLRVTPSFSLILNPSSALSPCDHAKFDEKRITHTHAVNTVLAGLRRTTCTHFSCSRQRRDYYQPPYTHEPILRTSVVEGDYLRPCISTLTSSDDQTTISAPATDPRLMRSFFPSRKTLFLLPSKLSIHFPIRCKYRNFLFIELHSRQTEIENEWISK